MVIALLSSDRVQIDSLSVELHVSAETPNREVLFRHQLMQSGLPLRYIAQPSTVPIAAQ
jgi:hypothetical protein